MIQLLFRNLWLKLLALALATAFWLSVASEPEMITIIAVPVEYNHYPANLEISSPITETINLEARGASGEISDLRNAHLAAIIDFSSVSTAGDRTFTITSGDLKLPRGATFLRSIPAQLRFRFERSTSKQVPVEDPPLTGTLPTGFVLKSVAVDPPALEISGPESRVAAVTKLTADPIDLSQIRSDTQQKVAVYSGAPATRIDGDPQVTVRIHVQPSH